MIATTPSASPASVAPWTSPATGTDPFLAPVEPTTVRLLVVDDEETIRLALAKFLRLRGYEVHTAGTGVEALALLAAGPYEAMLCDVRMPGMSGVRGVTPVATTTSS